MSAAGRSLRSLGGDRRAREGGGGLATGVPLGLAGDHGVVEITAVQQARRIVRRRHRLGEQQVALLCHRIEAPQLGQRVGVVVAAEVEPGIGLRSEEHTSELQSLMSISYAVFCLKKKN